MKLMKSASQADDPHVSFLDVIFCLCVFLVVLLSIMMTLKNHKSINSSAKAAEVTKQDEEQSIEELIKNHIVKDNSKKEQSKPSARFFGRGGQPKLIINVDFYKDIGLMFEIGGYDFTWYDFRRMICNFDRKEEGGVPAFVFSMNLSRDYTKVTNEEVKNVFKSDSITIDEIQSEKEKNRLYYIFNLYKKYNQDLEKSCNEFKLEYTTKTLGNWDTDRVGEKKLTKFEERRSKGNPYLWFTVDNVNEKILLGPKDDALSLSPEVFVSIIGSIKGSDGFCIEYRNPKTLKYDSTEEVPEWVIKKVIEPLGFYKRLNN
jgi:hypothetical protein